MFEDVANDGDDDGRSANRGSEQVHDDKDAAISGDRRRINDRSNAILAAGKMRFVQTSEKQSIGAWCARGAVRQDFVLMNDDDVLLQEDLRKSQCEGGTTALLLLVVRPESSIAGRRRSEQ